MSKQLVIGTDYGFAFGLPQGCAMIYNGANSWTAKQGNREMTLDNAKQTAAALEYINRPTVMTGSPR